MVELHHFLSGNWRGSFQAMLGTHQRLSNLISTLSTYAPSYFWIKDWIKKTIFKMFSWIVCSCLLHILCSGGQSSPSLTRTLTGNGVHWICKAHWTGINECSVLLRSTFEVSTSLQVNFAFPKQMLSARKDRHTHSSVFCILLLCYKVLK